VAGWKAGPTCAWPCITSKNEGLSTLWRKYGNVFGVVTPARAGPRSGAKAGVQEFWIPAFAGMTEPLAPLNNLSREYVTAFRTCRTKACWYALDWWTPSGSRLS